MAVNGPQVAEGGYTITSKQSTDMDSTTKIQNEEQTGRLQQPAVMRRSFLQVVREWFTGRTELVPYNYGKADCPRLRVGDALVFVPENEGVDYVAMSCGMSDTRYMTKGKGLKWKVVEIYGDGSALCERGKNRTITKYLSWSDGNRVTAKAVLFLHSELRWRVYYERRLSTAA
jgi:hypothetical protein